MKAKKHHISIITLGILIVAILISLTACGACEHTYDNSCDTACNDCGAGRSVSHDYASADCVTPKTCSICGATEGEALGHDMQEATCIAPSTCSRCPEAEGEIAPDNHYFKDEVCECQKIDAREMTGSQLDNTVRAKISEGNSTLWIILPADASEELFEGIRSALRFSSSIPDEGVDLTIEGATEIPSYAFGRFYEGYYTNEVKKIRSIYLPDAITINEYAFNAVEKLEVVKLPKAKTIGKLAFESCALTHVEAPLAISVDYRAFAYSTKEIEYVDLSSCVSIGMQAIGDMSSTPQFVDGAYVYLTAPGALEFVTGNGMFHDFLGSNQSTSKINLVLNSDKQGEGGTIVVTQNEDGTAEVKIVDTSGIAHYYNFKSVTFL